MSFVLLLLATLPLMFAACMQTSEAIIHHQMREELERKNLSTVRVHPSQLVWTDKGSECIINGDMFDVESYPIFILMTLYQFKLSNETEQKEAIREKGIYLSERIDGDYTFKLYQVDKFYVEEQWHTKFDVLRSFTSFMEEEKLKPYLEKINFSSLGLASNNPK